MPLPAYAFDLYGTLVDYASLRERMVSLVPNPVAFVDAWRAKQLQYAFISTLMGRYLDFDKLTERALEYTAALDGIALSDVERDELVDAWSHLPAFPDVPPTLHVLREHGCRLAVLSNGTPRALARTIEGAGLAGTLEGLLSVDAVWVYKPRPEVYQLAVDFFALPPDRIGFVSSNGWDAAGAAEFGLTVTWCNRNGLPDETIGRRPARRIGTLAELLDG
jgi:2-haloacid dehalogenase